MADDVLLAATSSNARRAMVASDFIRLCQARYGLLITGHMDRATLATVSAAERTEYFGLLLGAAEVSAVVDVES